MAGRMNEPEQSDRGIPLRLTAAVSHEPPFFVARCLEVEVASQGETEKEALKNLREALELYFEGSEASREVTPLRIVPLDISA